MHCASFHPTRARHTSTPVTSRHAPWSGPAAARRGPSQSRSTASGYVAARAAHVGACPTPAQPRRWKGDVHQTWGGASGRQFGRNLDDGHGWARGDVMEEQTGWRMRDGRFRGGVLQWHS
eukprot:365724-Chlamydomonas_euryale.AAC.2